MFTNNQFITGTLAVALTGSIVAAAYRLPGQIWRLVRNRLLFTVEIDNSDSAYPWVQAWLASVCRCRFLSATSVPPPDQYSSPAAKAAAETEFYLAPRGLCTFRFGGRRFFAWAEKDKVEHSREWRQTICFQCWRGKPDIFLEILREARRYAMERGGRKVEVWVPDGTSWSRVDSKTPRLRDSLLLPAGLAARILDDAQAFTGAQEWYATKGIPWHRGYLLHGPPGNGKSSLAHVLASELGTNISVANPSHFSDDAQMTSCLSRVPRGHVLLLEDIDACFDGREARTGVKITFNALLNALDGVTAADGRIVVMTTNHYDRLDPALTRPGRADVHALFANASRDQAAEIFKRFFPASPHLADYFAAGAAGSSMAALQEHLMRHRDNADEAASYRIGVASTRAA
jgi:chaperone BCS1